MTLQEFKKIVIDSLPLVEPDFYIRETYRKKLFKFKEYQWKRLKEKYVIKLEVGEYIEFKGLMDNIRRSKVK